MPAATRYAERGYGPPPERRLVGLCIKVPIWAAPGAARILGRRNYHSWVRGHFMYQPAFERFGGGEVPAGQSR